ncbi:MAG: hypothetical protein A2660_01760 [Candidatus Doudnabacteria bacterium RIFCSPHIGHO2_01_FULL_45_18]|uniref:Peptidase S11 D-alanyl-D-alanine carboxypeptidase A N-terminal domain-containing protein n=1 Tax=Candidatus Doudnabacteria bacterium RIFCSPHIGHO2_01_FULL_45_18 TaxID=1817823 RepID=A0A1F5NSR6_9BACT|nr:MAG: hypothetical protein A2660_01760 [Candidatus Doudnabacteria bacterium RIFCSPHIGHO2_01_FULL_45_18]
MLNKITYAILGIGIFFVFSPRDVHDSTKNAVVSATTARSQSFSNLVPSPEIRANLTQPALTAKASVAFDLDSGTILYAKSLDELLPIASLTKLLTALVVVENADSDDEVTIANAAEFTEGEIISVDNLLKAMLIASSNEAAMVLANFVAGSQENFSVLMNKKAEQMGLAATHFSTPVGWDIGDNYSNAWDLIKITQEFLKNSKLRQIVATKEITITSSDGKLIHQLRNTNNLLHDNPNVVGIKTGFTAQAKGNLIVLINHSDSQILTIVLGSDNREDDTQKLLDWAFQAYKW